MLAVLYFAFLLVPSQPPDGLLIIIIIINPLILYLRGKDDPSIIVVISWLNVFTSVSQVFLLLVRGEHPEK